MNTLVSPLYDSIFRKEARRESLGYGPIIARNLCAQPKSLADLRPGKTLTVTIGSTGTNPIPDVMRMVKAINDAHWDNPSRPKLTMRLNKRCDILTVKRVK